MTIEHKLKENVNKFVESDKQIDIKLKEIAEKHRQNRQESKVK